MTKNAITSTMPHRMAVTMRVLRGSLVRLPHLIVQQLEPAGLRTSAHSGTTNVEHSAGPSRAGTFDFSGLCS